MLSSHHPETKRSTRKLLRSTLSLLALLSVSFTAIAEQHIHMKVAHRFPAKHYLWSNTGAVFASEVSKASNGRVTFDTYPAAQLGKDSHSLLKSGLIDISIFVPSLETEKLPLSSVVELPNMYKTACEGTERYWQLARPGGLLGEGEFKKQGLHVLFVAAVPTYELMSTKKQITGLESLAGLKIRSNGASMIKSVSSLGAVPVQISAPEMYEALARGTVDGAMFPYYGLPDYHLEDITRYSTNGVSLGGNVTAIAISTRSWERLPADIQAIMTEAGSKTQAAFCTKVDKENMTVKATLLAQHNHVVTQLKPEEASKWNLRLKQITQEWLNDMNHVDQDGARALQAYLQTAAND